MLRPRVMDHEVGMVSRVEIAVQTQHERFPRRKKGWYMIDDGHSVDRGHKLRPRRKADHVKVPSHQDEGSNSRVVLVDRRERRLMDFPAYLGNGKQHYDHGDSSTRGPCYQHCIQRHTATMLFGRGFAQDPQDVILRIHVYLCVAGFQPSSTQSMHPSPFEPVLLKNGAVYEYACVDGACTCTGTVYS
jgi:hypothetical protein